MKKTQTTILALVFLLVLAIPVMGQGNQMHGSMGKGPLLHAPWNRIATVLEEIGLSDEQVDSIKQIRREYRHAATPLRIQLSEKIMDMKEMIEDGDLGNEKECFKLAEEITALKLQLMREKIHARFQIHSVLTVEQRRSLREKLFQMKRNKKGGRYGCGMGKRFRYRQGYLPDEN